MVRVKFAPDGHSSQCTLFSFGKTKTLWASSIALPVEFGMKRIKRSTTSRANVKENRTRIGRWVVFMANLLSLDIKSLFV
jgi:hypothetical protein